MKKFLKAIFSLMIVIAAICTVFMINTTKVVAVEDNIVGPGDSDDIVDSNGHTTSYIWLYKVTVYYDPDGEVTKESDISQYPVKEFKYYGPKSSEVSMNSFVGSKTKFEYVKDSTHIYATKLKNLPAGKVKFDSKIPTLSIGNDEEMGNASRGIINHFAGSNKEKCFDYVKDIVPSATKDGCWVLIVEPTVKAWLGSQHYFYTPTEYAVAAKSNGQTGAFNSFKLYTEYGYNLYSRGLTIFNGGNLSSMNDGTWFGLGTSKSVGKPWGKTESSFNSHRTDYIKYAGVFVWFSGAFEYSDYTLADGGTTKTEKFENEEIEISTVINRTNPGKAGTVDVTLDLQDYGIDGAAILDNNAKQSVSFDKGQKSKTVKWRVNVGSYSNYSTNRSYNYTVKVAATGTTKELKTDNNEIKGTITLKRDFQVTNVSIDKKECFENGVARVTFSVKNANPYKAYDGLPITVYFTYGGNTARMGEVTVNLGKNETKNGSCSINVGCVTDNCDQTDTVTVVINSWNVSAENGSKYSEPVMSNNKGSVNIRVKRDINLSVSIVYKDSWGNPIGNAPSKVKNTDKTQAITTCSVSNHSRFNLYEGDPMNDKVTVTFYVNNQKIGSQTVPVPRYGSNFVWFKWDVPEGSSVTLRAEVSWNVNQESAASPHADNTASITRQIDNVYEYDTPEMGQKDQDESGANANFSDAYAYQTIKPYIAKWSQWICDNKGTFTRIDYALTGDSALELTLDELAYDDKTLASGAGVYAVFTYNVRTECSEPGYDVAEKDYIYAQNVVASFPEFNYVIKGDCRTMYLSKEDGNLKNSEFRFEPNVTQDPTRKRRVHFTPKSMPDGEYKVGVVASQLWTPAGPIYVNAYSSVRILDAGNNWYHVS